MIKRPTNYSLIYWHISKIFFSLRALHNGCLIYPLMAFINIESCRHHSTFIHPISLSEVLKLVIWFFDINVPFSINEMDTNIYTDSNTDTPRRLKIIVSNGFLNSKDRMKHKMVSILLSLMNHTYQDYQKDIE